MTKTTEKAKVVEQNHQKQTHIGSNSRSNRHVSRSTHRLD